MNVEEAPDDSAVHICRQQQISNEARRHLDEQLHALHLQPINITTAYFTTIVSHVLQILQETKKNCLVK